MFVCSIGNLNCRYNGFSTHPKFIVEKHSSSEILGKFDKKEDAIEFMKAKAKGVNVAPEQCLIPVDTE